MPNRTVSMGFIAAIMEELIAVVYCKDVKKNTWYPNTPYNTCK